MGALKLSYELVKVLKEKFGEEQAEKIAGCIEASIDDRFDVIKGSLATKEDIASTKEDIAKLTLSTKEEIASTREAIARLDSKIESTSKQTLIWMFGMLITLLSLAVAAIKVIT
jgi:hypothetical protein